MKSKTAFFVISTHLGGAERSLLDFIKEIKGLSQDFLVVVPKTKGPLVDELNALNIQIETLSLPQWLLKVSRKKPIYSLLITPLIPFFLCAYLFKLGGFIRKQNIQKIHSTGLKFHALLCLYSLINSKVSIKIHLRDIIHSKYLKSYFEFFKNSSSVRFIANSK